MNAAKASIPPRVDVPRLTDAVVLRVILLGRGFRVVDGAGALPGIASRRTARAKFVLVLRCSIASKSITNCDPLSAAYSLAPPARSTGTTGFDEPDVVVLLSCCCCLVADVVVVVAVIGVVVVAAVVAVDLLLSLFTRGTPRSVRTRGCMVGGGGNCCCYFIRGTLRSVVLLFAGVPLTQPRYAFSICVLTAAE